MERAESSNHIISNQDRIMGEELSSTSSIQCVRTKSIEMESGNSFFSKNFLLSLNQRNGVNERKCQEMPCLRVKTNAKMKLFHELNKYYVNIVV
jgi:hypothetical protein